MAQEEHPDFFDDFEDEAPHPFFNDIRRGDLAAVKQRVQTNGAVLEERQSIHRWTPLMMAIDRKTTAIALWVIEQRDRHDIDTADDRGWTALHWASMHGPLEVVQVLVAAGANPAALTAGGCTPLIEASLYGHTDIVAFLLQLPAVKASIDHINQVRHNALSDASYWGHQPIVELLLDAGADPTIPAGPQSPLNRALSYNHHAIAALLRHIIAEAERTRALHKARSLLGAGAAALACLQAQVEQGAALPQLEPIAPPQQLEQQQQQQQQQQQEKLRATAAFAVGVSGGEKDTGLCEDLYVKLLGYMLPLWADKGPEKDDD